MLIFFFIWNASRSNGFVKIENRQPTDYRSVPPLQGAARSSARCRPSLGGNGKKPAVSCKRRRADQPPRYHSAWSRCRSDGKPRSPSCAESDLPNGRISASALYRGPAVTAYKRGQLGLRSAVPLPGEFGIPSSASHLPAALCNQGGFLLLPIIALVPIRIESGRPGVLPAKTQKPAVSVKRRRAGRPSAVPLLLTLLPRITKNECPPHAPAGK